MEGWTICINKGRKVLAMINKLRDEFLHPLVNIRAYSFFGFGMIT